MRKVLLLIVFACSLLLYAKTQPYKAGNEAGEKVIPQSRMAAIYEQVKTPYKYGLVVAPATNSYKIDCPTVFRKNGKWYMTYVIYNGSNGTDGRGYETWLATSDDLLHWTTKGRILSFRQNGWDRNQRGGFPALPDMT